MSAGHVAEPKALDELLKVEELTLTLTLTLALALTLTCTLGLT